MPDQVQTDRQRAETKARDIELAFFKPDFIEHPVKRPSLVELVATALLETEQRARSEGWEAAREEAAKVADRLSVGKTTDGLYTYDEPVGVTIRSLEYKEI